MKGFNMKMKRDADHSHDECQDQLFAELFCTSRTCDTDCASYDEPFIMNALNKFQEEPECHNIQICSKL